MNLIFLTNLMRQGGAFHGLVKLTVKKFFEWNWTEKQVRAALNFGYKEALNNSVTTGKYSFKYLGENVTVYLENGVFKTGYGDYVYTYDELLKLLGDK